MRLRAMIATLLLGCGHAAPAPHATPTPPPVETVTTTDAAVPEPDPESETDPREVGSVYLAFGYRTNGDEVYKADEDHDAAVTACFERAFPRATRQPFDTYYAYLVVPNPDADPDRMTYFQPITSGIVYPEPGTYPAFEACVRDAVADAANAPPDVSSIEVFVQVSSRAVEGVMGHGGD